MCGICGYVNIDGRSVEDGRILKRMMDALIHRGPDDEGSYISAGAALGHRRLSIIDLETGHQPMIDKDTGLVIVYNGEVYNFLELKGELASKGHVFTTRSDSEVVLKAYKEWGPDCAAKFNGMFAFAVWDKRDRSLFMARDRFGKKPVYFARFGNSFVFASEMKSLLCHPSVKTGVDRRALSKYFAYDYVPAPMTILKDVYKLEAGHYAVLKDGDLKKKRYWDFSFTADRRKGQSFGDIKQSLVSTLKESVRKRLISDVPLGVFLSGGIDSSAVVAMMAGLMDPGDIKTFSIGFKEGAYDESDSARLVARHFNTDHHEKILKADEMLKVVPKMVGIIDEPFADSSIIPTYIVSQFTRQSVKVALGGDGGDELFMGYPSFKAHRIAALYDKAPAFSRPALELLSKALPAGKGPGGLKSYIERFLKGSDFPGAVRHQVWTGSFSPSEQDPLFTDRADTRMLDAEKVYSESIDYYNTYSRIPDIDKIEYLYIKTYLTDDILAKVDRASMAVSLEVRAPFLDNDMAEASASIPDALKLKGFTGKYILKEALKGILPRSILEKRKHGFALPVGAWFRSDLKDLVSDTLSSKKINSDGVLNSKHIDGLLQDHISGRKDAGRKIWSLFVYQLWNDEFERSRRNSEAMAA